MIERHGMGCHCCRRICNDYLVRTTKTDLGNCIEEETNARGSKHVQVHKYQRPRNGDSKKVAVSLKAYPSIIHGLVRQR
jgi:hypothetical protein